MKTKDYWFALKSHVYVDFKKRKILLYDTKQGNRIETSKQDAIALITQLYEPEHLGVIPVKEECRTNPHLWKFIQVILDKGMGDLIEMDAHSRKPVRLIPILNLQKDIDKYAENEHKETIIGKDVAKYLLEVNIYLNDMCDRGCEYCGSYHRQVHCCKADRNPNELPLDDLMRLFEQLRYSSVNTINLLGGNILKYTYLSELQDLFLPFSQKIHCYVHYKNHQKHGLLDSQKLELIVTFPLDQNLFRETWNSIDKENSKLHFIIENEQQYDDTELLINQFDIKRYDIHPFYTGANINFFKENIFVNKEDIFHKTFQMREIFRNQKLNSNFFGTLYILPNGTIKANMNTPALGNIATDRLLDVVYKELIDNTAWRTIRDSKPCNKCVYQFLCPAPSDYERIIGQRNLCHIRK